MRLLLVWFSTLTSVLSLHVLPPWARTGLAWNDQQRTVESMRSGTTTLYFNQTIDHFSPNKTTFSQRFYINTQFWEGAGGPVFFTLCGEAPCSGPYGGYISELALAHKALVVALEHRFYGDSVPNNDWSTANLRFLTIDQVLADYDNFITQFPQLASKSPLHLKVPSSTQWLIIGGSYSGALSAWYRERTKLPQVVAAWSSSGVVNAILDFPQFDDRVATAVGPVCAEVLRNTTRQMMDWMASGKNVKALFNASVLSDSDFWYMTADSMAMAVQYGNKAKICGPMVEAAKEGQSIVSAFANFTNAFWGKNFGHSCFYDTQCLKTDRSFNRVWRWQKCSQLAYLQTAPLTGKSIRSPALTIDVLLQQCRAVFGNDIYPATKAINSKFGAAHPYGTRVWYSDASDDPWQEASVKSSPNPQAPFGYIQCSGCGHCIDLQGSQPTDPPALTAVRMDIAKQFEQWLG